MEAPTNSMPNMLHIIIAPLAVSILLLTTCVLMQPDPRDDFMREARGLPPLPALGYLPAQCFPELLWVVATALLTLAAYLLFGVAGPRPQKRRAD